MNFTKVGIFIIVTGGLINAILVRNDIGGIVRESTRVSIFVGVVLVIFGLLYKKGGSSKS